MNPAAPFINSLVNGTSGISDQVSYANNYQAVMIGLHPSEPNFVWAEAGRRSVRSERMITPTMRTAPTTPTSTAISTSQGDNFLARVEPSIMVSDAYKDGAVIAPWWDETEGGDTEQFTDLRALFKPGTIK